MKKFAETYYQDMKIGCQYCAIFSFSLGTLIFLLYLFSDNNGAIILGLYYTFFAIALNSILFTITTFCVIFSDKYRKIYIQNLGILLINVPIALCYFYVVIEEINF